MADRYPGLYKACLEIALDNGGVNRRRPERHRRRDFERWLASQPDDVLAPLDAWLSGLSEERLILVASGGQDEPETIAAREGAPPFLDDVFNSYFDEVC